MANMVDLQKLLNELKDEIVDVGITDCVKNSEILYPESPNPSVYLRFENHRYIADFQLWQGSMTYAITMADLADGRMRVEIDKEFNDSQEAECGAYWIISVFAGMPNQAAEQGAQPDAFGAG